MLVDYFPPALRERHLTEIRRHRLRREIIATTLANAVVDEQGVTSLYRLRDETGADLADAARTMVAATEVFDLSGFRAQVADLDHAVPAAVQTQMLLEARKLAERGARWLLRTRRDEPIGELVARYASGVATLIEKLPSILVGAERTSFDAVRTDLERAGVPGAIARRSAGLDELFGGLDCVELAMESGEDVESVAAIRFELEDRLGIVWLFDHVTALPRNTRWETLARLSLREDLLVQLRRLTGLVLAGTGPDVDADQRVATWLGAHEQAVDRLAQILGDIRAVGSGDLATLSVGLREVTQLR
jgi:glutamate dehydrogenase